MTHRKKQARIAFDMKVFKKVYHIHDARKLRRMAYFAFSSRWITFCRERNIGVGVS